MNLQSKEKAMRNEKGSSESKVMAAEEEVLVSKAIAKPTFGNLGSNPPLHSWAPFLPLWASLLSPVKSGIELGDL